MNEMMELAAWHEAEALRYARMRMGHKWVELAAQHFTCAAALRSRAQPLGEVEAADRITHLERENEALKGEMARRDENERRHCRNWGPCSRMDAAIEAKP